jgi:hypothetical protein
MVPSSDDVLYAYEKADAVWQKKCIPLLSKSTHHSLALIDVMDDANLAAVLAIHHGHADAEDGFCSTVEGVAEAIAKCSSHINNYRAWVFCLLRKCMKNEDVYDIQQHFGPKGDHVRRCLEFPEKNVGVGIGIGAGAATYRPCPKEPNDE